MTMKKLTKLLALYLPYLLLGLVATNFGEAWRLAEGKELGERIMSIMGTIPVAFANPLPSLHPLDLLVGLCCGAGLRLAVYLRGKNAKKYRHGMEYGSARWGNAKDIEPFMAPKFADNIILTKTERLMMSNRPPDPKNARNKNVLVVGGSGSGKTRFWLKPNLLQCHSSYVVTDPKGTIVLECGNLKLSEQPETSIGKYGRMRKSYLKEHRPILYNHLLMSEKLYPHLLEIERTAQGRVETMLPHMMETAGVTEELKACDPMRWVGLMNTLTAQIEEILIRELICS